MSPQVAARLEALQSAPLDSWIALSKDETKVVAIGSTYAEVVENSDRTGADDPLILKTPSSWSPISL